MVDLVDEIVTVAAGAATTSLRRSSRSATLPVGSSSDSPAARGGTSTSSPTITGAGSNRRRAGDLQPPRNAAKFDVSGAPIDVRVEVGEVAVMDRGPGIPPDDLAVVFERFHRAAAAQAMPTRLGLSIVLDVSPATEDRYAANREAPRGFVAPLIDSRQPGRTENCELSRRWLSS